MTRPSSSAIDGGAADAASPCPERPAPARAAERPPDAPSAGRASAAPESWLQRILVRGDLETKLAPPPDGLGAALGAPKRCSEAPERRSEATEPCNADGEKPAIERPARDPGLELGDGADALPRPADLRDARARSICLARFAHHELMAVELFAWALLRWPDVPGALRRAWLGVLSQEQDHCRLYLERLAAHGAAFEDFAPHSAYFWRQLPAIEASPHGPKAFLAAMGLTLEQANLDFTLVYRDAFRAAGDAASAEVCQRVHTEEVHHVRLAAHWLQALDAAEGGNAAAGTDGSGTAELTALYDATVPFPLGAARAKGRRFDVGARRRAGLPTEFIEHVRRAHSAQQTRLGTSSAGDPETRSR